MHFGQCVVIFIFKWKLRPMVFYGSIAARALLHSFFDRLTVVSAGKEKRVVSYDFCFFFFFFFEVTNLLPVIDNT